MRKFLATLSQYCDESSIPGLSRLSRFKTTKAKLVWTVVILLSFSGFTIHLAFNIAQYVARETITQATVYGTVFMFPDVTICGTTTITKGEFARKAKIYGKIVSGRNLYRRIQNFWRAVLLKRLPALNISMLSSKDNPLSRLSFARYMDTFNYQSYSNEMILQCHYKGVECDPAQFTQYQDPLYRNCVTFRPKDRSLAGGSLDTGLSVLLYTPDGYGLLDFEEQLARLHGVAVAIHAPNSIPIMQNTEIFAKSGEYTRLPVEMTKTARIQSGSQACVTADHQSNIEINGTHWKQPSELVQSYKYSQDACEELQLQQAIIARCSCLSEHFIYGSSLRTLQTSSPLPDRPYCHDVDAGLLLEPAFVVRNNSVFLRQPNSTEMPFSEWKQDNIRKILERHQCFVEFNDNISKSEDDLNYPECLPLCESITYFTSATSHIWPESLNAARLVLAKLIKKKMNETKKNKKFGILLQFRLQRLNRLESIRRQYLQMDIFAKHRKGTLITETLAYTFPAFLSDVGGVLGLWAGMSIITFIEIFSGMAEIYARNFKQRRRQSTITISLDSQLSVK